MSRAFVRETEAEVIELPDRPISPHPNFVTLSGLATIDARVHALNAERDAAVAAEDQATLPGIDRELRYWRQRRDSARVVEPSPDPKVVRFGVSVRLQFDDGSGRDFRLVGEDEADPAAGLLSWTSPVAKALIGRRAGDILQVFGREAEIVGLRA
ncbi:MAG TPA: GreA/GreB family elongation factor [Steroidobacteraceae bacterium]|jgi:transcription elongation GreA/GreB family factor|nr:GreA/GreB family elongation factor [Steroidobacteraceae bacterium]